MIGAGIRTEALLPHFLTWTFILHPRWVGFDLGHTGQLVSTMYRQWHWRRSANPQQKRSLKAPKRRGQIGHMLSVG
jgi:hypothetical protein